jgi:hypothetical protein
MFCLQDSRSDDTQLEETFLELGIDALETLQMTERGGDRDSEG